MNNKFDYIQFHNFTNSSSTPVRILKVPISFNQAGTNFRMLIELSALSSKGIMKSLVSLYISRTENTDTFSVLLSYMKQSDKRIAVKGAIIGNYFYLYAKISSALSGTQCSIHVIESDKEQYMFEDIVEDIPENANLYECTIPNLFNFAENTEAHSTYGNYSYSDNYRLTITCGIKVLSTLSAGDPILNDIGAYDVAGFITKADGTVMYPVKRSSTNLVSSSDIPAGYYIIQASGIVRVSMPTFD